MIKVEKLNPFGRMCVSLGMLPSSYKESLTYEEQLLWFCNYLTETVIPTVNNNAEAVEELQALYTQIKTYVDGYFDNLDVQEEINNKLDEMAASGQLTNIIAQYLGLGGMITFDSVADMKNATNLVDGSKCATLGYYSVNDGGNAFYKVRTITNNDVVDGMLIIGLHDNSLIAELIVDKTINVKQLGAKGNGVNDDTSFIKKAIEYFHVGNDTPNQNYSTVLIANYPNAGGTIYFPKGIYCISETLKIPCYVDLDLGYSTLKAISGGSFVDNFMLCVNSVDANNWTYGYVPRIGFIKNGLLDGNDIANIKGIFILDPHTIKNIEFSKLYKSIFYKGNYVDNITIESLTVKNVKGSDFQIEKTSQCDCIKLSNIHFPVNDDNNNECNAIRIVSGHSGKIENIINGVIKLTNTEDYTISNWHCEKGGYIGSGNSNTIIRDSNIYIRNNSTPIKIEGESLNNQNRTSTLENISFIYYLNNDQFNYDTKDIDISSYYQQLFIKNCYRYLWNESIASFSTVGITIYDGAKYIINNYDECEVYNKTIRPKFTDCRRNGDIINAASLSNQLKWNLTTGTYYYKVLNLCDVNRLTGKTGAEVSVNVNTVNSGVKLSLANSLGNGNVLRIFRGTSSNTYNSYVDIPNPKCVNLFDNGYSLNGYKWKSINSSDVVTTTNSIGHIDYQDLYDRIIVRGKGYNKPTVGTWKQGDIVERINPSANASIGWVCITEGTPGTWKTFGNVEA